MRHVRWLGLCSLVATLGASAPALARENPFSMAVVEPPAAEGLEDGELVLIVPSIPALELDQPCFGCRDQLRIATHRFSAAEPEPVVAPAAPPPQPKPVAPKQTPMSIGDTWKLRNGRAFSMHLTPSPEECAPLVRLSF